MIVVTDKAFAYLSLNRTMVGLKEIFVWFYSKCQWCLNRTMVGLKMVG